jgi:hypothetical protein
MTSTSREWRTAELEALKNYDPAIIIALYARIPCKSADQHARRHVSFSYMIEAIVDAEEVASFDSETTSVVVI